jgi:acetyl-CoA carboxylase biotin carboxyl carrier protein
MEIRDIKKLLELLGTTDVTELQIETEGSKVRIKREKFLTSLELPRAALGAPPQEPAAAAPSAPESPAGRAEETQRVVTVTSPLVGTFYRAASPDAQPFVEVGDRVSKGQVICIVEAMKLMNEIEADVDGVIAKVLVENSQPVEYGEPLFLVEPL